MRKYFPILDIYEEAVSHIRLCNCSILNFLIYEENLIIFFIRVCRVGCTLWCKVLFLKRLLLVNAFNNKDSHHSNCRRSEDLSGREDGQVGDVHSNVEQSHQGHPNQDG